MITGRNPKMKLVLFKAAENPKCSDVFPTKHIYKMFAEDAKGESSNSMQVKPLISFFGLSMCLFKIAVCPLI